jgi:phage terminase large subunit-like protein
LEEEVKLKKSKKLLMYQPNPKQEQFHLSNASVRSIFGANRTGKTTAGVVEFMWHMTGNYPAWYPESLRMPTDRPIKGRIFAKDFQKMVGLVIIPTITEWMDDTVEGPFIAKKYRNPIGIPVRWVFKNGNEFDILTYEMSTEQCEGWKGDIAWFDEPPPRDKFIATKRGLVDTNGRCWLTLTPLTQPWIYDELYARSQSDPSYFCVTMDIRDNLRRIVDGKPYGYLTEEAILDFEKTLSPDEREARLHGKFLHLSGLIFKEFDPSLHIIEKTGVKANWYRIMAIDPHPRKPTACLWLAVNPDNELFVYDELLFNGSISDLASAIRAQEGTLRAHLRLIDPSADQEVQLRPSIRTELMKYKIWCERGSNDVELGISKVHEALTPDIQNLTGIFDSRLKISRLCPQLVSQILHYVWDEYRMRPEEHDPKEKPMPKNDDLITCLRYILVHNPQYYNTLENEEEDDEVRYVGQFAKYPDSSRKISYKDLVEKEKHG